MPEYTLRIRRYSPESGEAAHWQDFDIDLDGHRSVLDGILQAKDREDGSIGIRCSCRAAICGSCGVRINGKPNLACHTHLDKAFETAADGVIVVEPMGNMPVIKDLIVDMDAVHWKKMRRVTPWLLPEGDPPEREYIVPPESMIDITQTMACIQCGACVSDCLSMEVDPLFIGPAALAKAYRFVGDPRDGQHEERLTRPRRGPARHLRLHALLQLHRGVPEGRRADEPDHAAAADRRLRLRASTTATTATGTRWRSSRTSRRNGLLHEADLLPDSYGGKFHPRAVPELLSSLPVDPRGAAARQGDARRARCCTSTRRSKEVKRIFRDIHDREERFELNLYVVGEERRGRGAAAGRTAVKVAYWPGCVSRGFTPELHGSMAQVAPLLDIELVELDRAACCGAGVIAEHNQELADTLNARTFALAQQEIAKGASTDDEHLLDLPGRAERVPGAPGREHPVPRPRQRDAVGRGAHVREGHHQQALPLAAGRGDRPRRRSRRRSSGRLTNLRVGPFYGCYIVRPTDRLGIDREHPRDTYLHLLIEALGGTVVDYAGQYKCCGFPIITMNKQNSLQAGGPPPR